MFTGIFLLTFISLSHSADWEFYGVANSDYRSYDKENIQYLPNSFVRVWEKRIYFDAGEEEEITDIIYSIVLYQINCNKKTYSLLYNTSYDSIGGIISSDDNPAGKESFIIPDSITDDLYKIVCKETKQE